MYKIKLLTSLMALIISTLTFAQKKMNMQFIMQTGNSFISGQWRNLSASNSPPFNRKITPALEAGVNAVFNFKGKAGKKVVYDEMYESGFYLADKIAFGMGIFYSFCGESYKDMKQADITWSKKLRLQYLKIPLQAYFIKGKENDNQLIYTAGFYAGYLTYYKEKNSITGANYQSESITKGSTMVTTYSVTGSPAVSSTSYLWDNPYNFIDYGASLGVGMQKKLNDDWTLQLLIIGQKGFADIKNKNARIATGNDLHPYFGTNVNTYIKHTNSSIEVTIGLKKHFEWTPKPKEEKKHWRIFRKKF